MNHSCLTRAVLVIATLTARSAATQPCAPPNFAAAVSYASGTNPFAVAAADLNGDGKLDLVTASWNDQSVWVLLGNGDGTFQTAIGYHVGSGVPYDVAVADFNSDGRNDLAVVDYNNVVWILLGNGDGTFQLPIAYPALGCPKSVAIGDFNGDGNADVVAADPCSFGVSVLLGNGDGTLRPAVSYPTGGSAWSAAVADLNGDGKADVAVANFDDSNVVSILLGNGDGTFGNPVSYAAGSYAHSIAIGSLDGNASPDIVVANYYSQGVTVLLGNGDGTFGGPAFFSTAPGAPVASVAIADFNDDNKSDLAVTTEPSVSVLLGRGDGTFGAAVGFGVEQSPSFVAVADLDGNGSPDLAVANTASGSVSILLNTHLPPRIAGPQTIAEGATATYVAGGGYDTYQWTLDGSPIATTKSVSLSGLSLGHHALQVSVMAAGCGPPASSVDINVVRAGAACGAEMTIVADGRLTPNIIATGATAWFGVRLHIGNSYSAEFKSTTYGDVAPGTLTVFKGDDGCSGTSTLSVTDTAAVDPVVAAAAARVSFTAAGTSPFFRMRLENVGGAGLGYTFGVSETTMFSASWSTNGAFDTYYSFQNTTTASLHATLMLLDMNGLVLFKLPLSIASGHTASVNTSSLGVTRNRTGTAKLTHDGPIGAFVVEAAIANYSINPPYVQSVKLQTVREAR